MILVTGATGTTGSLVLRQLQARGHAVRAMTRSKSRLAGAPGVEADFDDPASLAAAVAGADAIYLVTVPSTPSPRHDEALLAAARRAGVRSVVRLSAIGTGETFDGRTVGAWHSAADEMVRAAGLEWTLLRPTSFATNTLSWAGPIRDGVPVPNLTGDAPAGVVDPRDVAAVAVEALTSDAHHGRTYTLTGPELLSVPEQAAQLAGVIGRPVTTEDVPPDLARERFRAAGMPAAAVEAIILGVRYARAGHNAVVSGDVDAVLGRPGRRFGDWAAAHREEFAG